MNEVKNKKWHAHYPPGIPAHIEYAKKPLHAFLEESAKQYGKMKALYFMGKEMTFEEVYQEAKSLASFLQANGLQKGDRVSVMLPNTPQAVISYYGILIAGGIVVQTNPLYTERELEYQLKDSGSKVIISLDILLPKITHIRDKTDLEHVIVAQIKDYLPFPKNVFYPRVQKKQYNLVVKVEESEDTHLWSTALKADSERVTDYGIDPENDLALLQYTGGTTGSPKGVMLTHYNLVSNGQMAASWLDGTQEKQGVVLGVLPFFHVYGMTTVMNYAIMTGSKIILLPKFEVESVLKAIEKQKPTIFPGAPTIYIGLLNHPKIKKYDLSSIEACISGSAPLPVEVQEQFETITKGKLVEGYGLTETSPVTHSNFINGKRINGSVGVPWPDTEAKILKLGTLEEAETGEVGEIAVKGPQVMKGYWNRKEETEAVLIDGWLLTGDIGYMNEEGYFFIVDRKKDMIIAGGFNIYPREIEEVLYEYAGIQEVAIVGIPDPYRGETVKAFIVPKEGVHLTEEELDTFCRVKLAPYKVPRIYEFRKELPKTAVGKILRRKLMEEEKEKNQPIKPETV